MTSPVLRLRELKNQVSRQLGRREAIQESIKRDEADASVKETDAEQIDKAIEVIQAATEVRRQQLRDRVENLVTRGLRAVFHREDFEFAFKVNLKRDVFGVEPVLRSRFGGREIETEIDDARAGGIKDVVAFLLRVIVLSLARPRVAPVLILDESFSHVSPDLLRGVAVLLKELSESAGIQFILVTHKPELLDSADVIYRARKTPDEPTEFLLEHDLRDESFHRRARRGEKGLDRFSKFDCQDLSASTEDSESVLSETTDVLARRQRQQAIERSRLKRPKGRRKRKKR